MPVSGTLNRGRPFFSPLLSPRRFIASCSFFCHLLSQEALRDPLLEKKSFLTALLSPAQWLREKRSDNRSFSLIFRSFSLALPSFFFPFTPSVQDVPRPLKSPTVISSGCHTGNECLQAFQGKL